MTIWFIIVSQVGITLLLASLSPLANLACWGCELTLEEKEAVVKVFAKFLFQLSFPTRFILARPPLKPTWTWPWTGEGETWPRRSCWRSCPTLTWTCQTSRTWNTSWRSLYTKSLPVMTRSIHPPLRCERKQLSDSIFIAIYFRNKENQIYQLSDNIWVNAMRDDFGQDDLFEAFSQSSSPTTANVSPLFLTWWEK